MKSTLIKILPFALIPITAHADRYEWTGATDTDWDTATNWTNLDGVGGVPDDESDEAIFNAGATTVTLNSDYLTRVTFQTAGWTIDGSGGFELENEVSSTPISSAGVGTNTIAIDLFPDLNVNVDVGAGNSLVHTGRIQLDGSITKTGAGTMILNSSSVVADTANVSSNGGLLLINYAQQNSSGNGVRPGATLGGGFGGSGTIAVGGSSQTANLQLRIGQSGSGYLAPGGDGSAAGGPEIGTLGVDFANAGSSNVVTMYNGSTLEIDINATADTTDLIEVTKSGSGTGGLWNINTGATLDITTVGGTGFDLGDTFIISTFINSENVADYGSFGTVLIDGADAFLDPNFFINYNLNSIELGLVPEPSAYAAILGVAVIGMAYARRRNRI